MQANPIVVYTRQGFFSPSACEQARALFPDPEPAAVRSGEMGVAEVKVEKRVGKVSFFPPGIPQTEGQRAQCALSTWMFEALSNVNKRLFGYELESAQPLQLAEYNVGDAYHWHLDLGPGDARLRKLSATVQLTDPNAYEGGELEFWNTPPADSEQGTLIVFPSYLLHRVTPVTHGTRYALVAWAIGSRPFC